MVAIYPLVYSAVIKVCTFNKLETKHRIDGYESPYSFLLLHKDLLKKMGSLPEDDSLQVHTG